MRFLYQLFLGFILCVVSVFSIATEVDYVGPYTHLGKPAIIMEFNDGVAPDVKDIKVTLGNSDQVVSINWFLNQAENAFITTDVEIGQRYNVQVANGEQTFNQQVEIAEIQPAVKLLGRGPFVMASGSRTLPISAVNLSSVSVEILRLNNQADLLSQFYYPEQASGWRVDQLSKYFTTVTTLQFDLPTSAKNEAVQANIRIPDEVTNGWYLVAIKGGGQFSSDNMTVAQLLLTDIGLQAKVYPEQLNVNAVWLKNDAPLPKAKVWVLTEGGKKTLLGQLNNGAASLAYKAHTGDVLLVESEQGLAYLPLREVPLDLSDFSVDGRDYQAVEAFTYSNRDLFKPGESLPLNIVLRDADGAAIKQNSVYVELVKPDGKVVIGQQLTEQGRGFFQQWFDIPKDAPLGRWSLMVKANKAASKALSVFSFNVSEFVPERMDLTFALGGQGSAKKPLLIGQERVDVTANGRYLFGAPAAGNELKLNVTYQSVNELVGPYQDYFVGTPFYVDSYRDLPELPALKLDQQGDVAFSLPLIDQQKLKGPAVANISFELLETGGAAVTRQQQALLWRNLAIPGIRAEFDEAQSFSHLDFKVINLSSDGTEPMAGKLEYKLERNRGGYYWTYSEAYGWDLVRDNEWRPVLSEVINVNQGEAADINVAVEWGDYRVRLRNSDGVETLYTFYAGWQEGGQQKPAKPDHLGLTLDKPHYKNGEQVSVTLNSDFDGEVQLALEAGKILWQQNVKVVNGQGSAAVTIPADLKRHDIYLTATQVITTEHMPRRLFSIKPVLLDRQQRIVKVAIEHQQALRPLEEATFTITAAELAGEQAWLTLSLMDKGITNLSRYQVPSISDWFFSQRRYGADVVDLYSRQYQQRPDSFLRHRYGGDMSANDHLGDLVEAKTITIMSKLVSLDANGQAAVSLELPDYNGEAQVVATVFSAKQVGQQVEDVAIAAPLVAELSVPRFIAPGDKTQTLLEVFNQSGEVAIINAQVSADEALSLEGNTQLEVTLQDGERASLPVSLSANKGFSKGQLTLTLASDVYSQTRSWQVPVRSPEPILSYVVHRTLAAGESVWLNENANWPNMTPVKGKAGWLSYSSTAMLNIGQYAQHLFAYPYGCAEQTTSKALPWLYQDSSLDPLKAPILENKTERQLLSQAVQRLSGMQKANGSFAMWSKHGDTRYWISAYVSDFLARVNQYDEALVPDDMFNASQRYLGQLLQQKSSAAFYSAWILAREGQVTVSDLWQLEQVSFSSALDSAHLGAAFMLAGDAAKGQQYLLNANIQTRQSTRWQDYDYGSAIRDNARIISLLAQLEQRVKLSQSLVTLRNQLVEKVVQLASKDRYLSTQENNALVEAGISLKQLNQQPVGLILDGVEQTAQGQGSAPMWPELVLENKSANPVYVIASAQGHANANTPPRSTIDVEHVNRTFYQSNGQSINTQSMDGDSTKQVATVAVGDKLIVVLTVKLKEYLKNGLLVEQVPTGFVLEDPAFTNSDALIASVLEKTDNAAAERIEYRNDRWVVALPSAGEYKELTLAYVLRAQSQGQAKMPALYIEDMYQPARFIYQTGPVAQLNIQ
ncbi:alpha-2-macroglobulin family protein [Motilimonas cestriensis]|uniref:alpha-2-macroglobulin family protein n=1 Tax=Motilimonas cestriensis TaxID=2742685 RepID=UPI003DA3BEE6